MLKKILLFIIIIALAGGATWFFIYKNEKKEQPYKTEHPTGRDLVQFVTATGTLRAKEQISIGSLVAGRVVKILADDNDEVKKDQILAILDNGIGDSSVKNAKAQLLEAQARLVYTTAFFKRQEKLYASGQLAKNLYEQYEQDYKIAQAKVQQLEATVELETKTYNNLFIRSPDDGIVIAKRIDLGQQITSQLQAQVLYDIAKNLHEMEAWIDIDEADVGLVKEQQEAIFSVDAFPKLEFSASVKQIQYLAKIVDNVVTYAAILEVSNPDLQLRPGMTTNVSIKVAEALNALTIPNKALRINTTTLEAMAKKHDLKIEKITKITNKPASPGGKVRKNDADTVWILDHTVIRQKNVELGVMTARFTQVTEGLTEHDTIITEVEEASDASSVLSRFMGGSGGIGKS